MGRDAVMAIVELTRDTFASEVLQAEGFVVIDFWAIWCTPCRMLTTMLEEIAAARTDIKICKMNFDEAETIAEQYGIMSLPTLLFFQNGELVDESIGMISKEHLLSFLPNSNA